MNDSTFYKACVINYVNFEYHSNFMNEAWVPSGF